MTAFEISAFMKKWRLQVTPAAAALGISYSTLHNALAGKTLSPETQELMKARKAEYEAARDKPGPSAA